MITAPGGQLLSFDPIEHAYRLPGGERVPSVTEILGAVGVSVDFEALGERSPRTADAILAKRQLGHALHADAHAFDDDDLVLESVDERVRPYLDAWITFRANMQLTPEARERRVYHDELHFAGTLDGIFRLPSGRRVLVDIKTGDPDDSGCQFQTAAYQAAYLVEHPHEPIHERWGVQLVPGAVVPYRISPYADWRDWACFKAFVTTYHCQVARRGRRS